MTFRLNDYLRGALTTAAAMFFSPLLRFIWTEKASEDGCGARSPFTSRSGSLSPVWVGIRRAVGRKRQKRCDYFPRDDKSRSRMKWISCFYGFLSIRYKMETPRCPSTSVFVRSFGFWVVMLTPAVCVWADMHPLWTNWCFNSECKSLKPRLLLG